MPSSRKPPSSDLTTTWAEIGGVPANYLPLPISTSHYYAIGHVAAMWNAIEIQIQWLLWAVMGVNDETGRLLTASLRLETHLSVLEIITEMRPLSSEQKREIAYIIAESKRLKERRNTIVHSNWVIDSWDKPPRTHKLTLKQSQKGETFTAEEINAIAIEINSLLRRSLKLHLALRGS